MKKSALWIMLLALTVVFCVALAACQPNETPVNERTVSGVVSSDVGAIEGAEVSIRSTSYKTTTDSEGKFSIKLSLEDSKHDQYTLSVSKSGFLDKTAVVAKSDFKNDAADVKITLLSDKLTVKGVVTKGGAAFAGVTVKVSSEETSAVTDAEGKYSLEIDRPVEEFKITFTKDFHDKVEKTVSEFDVTEYALNVEMKESSFKVSGVVSHYFNGILADARVSVKGETYSAVTDAEGKFEISEITKVNLPYTLVVSKDGYQTSEVLINDGDTVVDVELRSQKIDLGTLSPSNKSFTMQTVRDSKGLYFYFTSAQQFVNGDKICIYINVNETGRAMSGSTVLEFALEGSDAGGGICVIWNQKTNESATEHATINWGSEVKYYLVNDETNGSSIEAFISYETFAKLGEDFAIDKNSVVGITFFDRGAGAQGAAGWDRPDMPGFNNAPWVHPDDPRDYVRFAPENVIYEADNNTYVPYGDYTVNVTVRDEQGNPVEGAAVNITSPYSESKTTGASGAVDYALTGVKFAQVPTLTVSKRGYVEQLITVERRQFTNKIADVTVTLVEAQAGILDESGRIVDFDGALEGVDVQVKDYESKGSVTTNAQGEYDLTALGIDLEGASTYTLVLTKLGYRTQEVAVTVGGVDQEIYLRTNGDLGAFGRYGWNTRIDRDDTKLIIDLKSDKNWYGMKDLDGNATATENEMQIYFVKDLTAKNKTAEGLFELTIVEKVNRGEATDWAGWRDGVRDFITPFPAGIVYSIINDTDGCRIHVEVAYDILGITATDTIGLGLGEWYGIEGGAWTCPFYDGATQTFVNTGWAVNVNDPSTCLHWKQDNTTQVVFVA